MSKQVMIMATIDDKAYEIMYGGRNGTCQVNHKNFIGTLPYYEVNLTTETGRTFHADAIGAMLLAESQKVEHRTQLMLGYNEIDPEFFTTKE